MFVPATVDPTTTAGALSTDDINVYQSVGALTVVSVVGASTLAMSIAAPLPVLGTVAVGSGLMYYGTKIKNAKSDTPASTTASTTAGFPEPQDSGAELEQPAT